MDRTKLGLAIVLFLSFSTPSSCQDVIPLNNRAAQYKLALEAIFGMGVRLQSLLGEDHRENFIVSPISATVIIGQLMLGAEGEFRKQLYDLLSLQDKSLENDVFRNENKNKTSTLPYARLHLQLSSLLKDLEGNSDVAKQFTLRQKSAVFVNGRIQLQKSFVKNLQDFYLSRDFYLNFQEAPVEAQRFINQWAATYTNGLIKNIIAYPPPPTTASIFANAIYFLAEWQTPFSDVLNKDGVFNVTTSKTVDVTYMMGFIEQIFYAETSEYHMICLPYKNEELGMYIILPNKGHPLEYDVKRFTQSLKSSEVLDTVARAKRRNVFVKIPKMVLSSTVNILKPLRKYHAYRKTEPGVSLGNRMVDVVDRLEAAVDKFTNFTTQRDENIFLTSAAVGGNLRVDDIVQEVVFSINEKGTEVAVVTASTIDYMGGNKNFIIDKPFVFFITHEATSATLFWGTISNPAA